MSSHELRPLVDADRDLLLTWRNRPYVRRQMFTDHVIDPEEHAAWLARSLARDDSRYWVIRAHGRDVGVTNLYDLDPRHGTCFWAIYIGEPDVRGSGAGAFAQFTVMETVFGELGLRKLCCEALAPNTAALALYEGAGFVREGVFRSQVLKEGEPVDVVRLGILAEEWTAVRDRHRQALSAKGVL